MKRVLTISLLGLVFQSLAQVFSLSLPACLGVFFLAPLILVFSLQYFKPLETIAVCLFCGAIIDAMGGFIIGLNIIILLICAFFLGATNLFSRRANLVDLSLFVGFCSLIYRIVFLLVQFLAFGEFANIYISQLLFGPLIDAAVSAVFFPLLVKILCLIKAFEQNEVFKVKIGSRL